jgi:hypothetical protein
MAYKSVVVKKTISEAVGDAFSELQCLRDEMREKAEALEEKFSGTEKYQTCNDTADTLDGFCDEEPEMGSDLGETELEYGQVTNTRGVSRANRCSNAVQALTAVKELVEDRVEELQKDDDRGKVGDALLEELEEFVEIVGNAIDGAEGLDFPGMY